MKVSFIGAGSWGTALSIVVADNAHEVKMWDIDENHIKALQTTRRNDKYLNGVELPDNIEPTSDIEYCLKDADVLVIAVASQAYRIVMENNAKLIDEKTIIVNVAKGIENKTLLVIHFYPSNNKPHYIKKEGKLKGTYIRVGSSNRLATLEIIENLEREKRSISFDSVVNIRVYTNPDVIGVELGGALKNIIALAAGISDGMGFGDNAKAALMTRGIREITRLGIALGADVETFTGLTGVGDLIVTCTSMHSRNRRCGIMIGEGLSREKAQEKVGMVVEGIYATKAAYDLSKVHNIEMPIVDELYKVLYENADAKQAVRNLMLRSRKHEMEEVINNSAWK